MKFDCSQMAVYLEHTLENSGYHTTLSQPKPGDWECGHIWIMVEIEGGGMRAYETTNGSWIDNDPRYYRGTVFESGDDLKGYYKTEYGESDYLTQYLESEFTY